MKTTEKLNKTIPASPVAQQARTGKTLPAVPVLQKLATTEEEPAQRRSVAPFQLMTANGVVQLLNMKDADKPHAKRTDYDYDTLEGTVNAIVADNDLDTLNITSRDLRLSIANRSSRRLDDGHAGRVELEERLLKDVNAAIKIITDAAAAAKAAKAAEQARKNKIRKDKAKKKKKST